MPTTPDTDVADVLATLSTWTKGTNLFMGPERAPDVNIPHLACFVLATGGAGPMPYADGTTTNLRYSMVQVTVRSAVRGFAAGQTLAREIRDKMHITPPTGYLECRTVQTEPVYVGETEEGSHLFTVNLELIHEQ
jgi:hypothetical protein